MKSKLHVPGFSGTDKERWQHFRQLCRESNEIHADDHEARAEARAGMVDRIIREYGLQVPHSVRPNLRPVGCVAHHLTMVDAFGDFMALVTDGIQCWVQIADGRIEILHWTNIVLPKIVKEEVEKKPKKKKPLTKSQLALLETLKELGVIE